MGISKIHNWVRIPASDARLAAKKLVDANEPQAASRIYKCLRDAKKAAKKAANEAAPVHPAK